MIPMQAKRIHRNMLVTNNNSLLCKLDCMNRNLFWRFDDRLRLFA